MGEMAIVMASDVSRYGRMDAGFHIARVRTEDATEALKERYDAAQVVEMLGKVDNQTLAAVKPLLRGGSMPRAPKREELLRAVEEYPHIALALVREAGQANMDRIRNEIADREQALDDMRDVMGEPK